MSFRDDLMTFHTVVATRNDAIFTNVVSSALSSITDGSPLTGSPGQPVDHGDLKGSWQITRESSTSALISTHEPYAQSNEDGIARPGGGPYELRSSVGGRHSVSKTIANIGRIVDDETKKAGGS